VLCCAALFCVLAGCASHVNGMATLHGMLLWPRGSQPVAFTAEPTAGIVDVMQERHVVATIDVGQSGQFVVELAAGTYSLTGESLYFWSGDPLVGRVQGKCASEPHVKIRAGESVSLDADCHLLPGGAPS
jgi:hypothetical protein